MQKDLQLKHHFTRRSLLLITMQVLVLISVAFMFGQTVVVAQTARQFHDEDVKIQLAVQEQHIIANTGDIVSLRVWVGKNQERIDALEILASRWSGIMMGLTALGGLQVVQIGLQLKDHLEIKKV